MIHFMLYVEKHYLEKGYFVSLLVLQRPNANGNRQQTLAEEGDKYNEPHNGLASVKVVADKNFEHEQKHVLHK